MAEASMSRKIVVSVILFVIICLALTCGLLVHFLAKSPNNKPASQSLVKCSDECVFTLVESIPDGMTYPEKEIVHQATGPTILRLLQSANQTIHVASFYWTLRTDDFFPTDPITSQQGVNVFNALYDIGQQGTVKVKIVQSEPDGKIEGDTEILGGTDSVEVRSINFPRLIGAGILHTKMWLVDGQHFYVGSANVDWRSFTQVKEMGVLVQNCSCLADDMEKIFQVYWNLAGNDTVMPTSWSKSLSARFNIATPMSLANNTGDNNTGSVYLSSSPPSFCPEARTTDIDAILNVINKAESFVYVAVMDYVPAVIYSHPNSYWPVIDDALRTAAYDTNVTVRLLASKWNHSPWDMLVFLKSLEDFGNTKKIRVNLEVRIFEVPANASQALIPYARVNHNKYMVTDKHAYIGTSNWSGDYFISTGGVGFIMEQPRTGNSSSNSLRQQLVNVFQRDWNSAYSKPIRDYIIPEPQ